MTSIDSSRTAVVNKGLKYYPVTPQTPRGQKMLLINRASGVAVIDQLSGSDGFYTHWFPLPTFDEDDHASNQEATQKVPTKTRAR